MIRPATKADLPFITVLQQRPENRAFVAEDSPERLTGLLQGGDEQLLIWEDHGAPEGFCILRGIETKKTVIELLRLAVANPGEGRGTRFIEDMKTHVFQTLGAHKLWLDVATDNPRARRAYEKSGFTHEGTLRAHWPRRTGDHADLALYGLLRGEWQKAG
ncbi:GNAT family N-acetyltransferase [Aestuariibius sp. 2305UL40-4]|uniref:GNAT family N-acetyltransferase n=1 Tax=Aestuariibius violaceus TaxID=3234132 RepID=UPI00345EEEAF